MTKKKNSPSTGSKQAAQSRPGSQNSKPMKGQTKINVSEGVVAKVLKSLPKGSLAAVGGLVGSAVGMPGVGAAIGTGISAITGVGDYTVQANTLATSGTASLGVPQFNVGSTHSVAHRECLGTLTATGVQSFQINADYRFNPGDGKTFPWLSAMAKNFQSYRVKGAVVVFESNTSEFSSNPYMGTVCIGTKYDVNEAPFGNMVEMQNAKFSVSGKPSQHLIHPIECAKGFQPTDVYYIRNGTESTTAFNFDKCMIYVATEGITGSVGQVLGRLWITYDIELINPILPTTSTPTILNQARPAEIGVVSTQRDPFAGILSNLNPVAYTDPTGTYYYNPTINGRLVFQTVTEALSNLGRFTAASIASLPFPNGTSFRVYRNGVYSWRCKTTATDFYNVPSAEPSISGTPVGASYVKTWDKVNYDITAEMWEYTLYVKGLCGGSTFSDVNRYYEIIVPIDQDINATGVIHTSQFEYIPASVNS